MKFLIIDKNNYDYKTLKKDIDRLFDGDNHKIADSIEFMNHLNYIFAQKANQGFLVLLYENNILISMVNYFQYDNQMNYWCEFTLFVNKNYRNKNYAQMVFLRGLEELRKYSCNKLICGIEKDNISSIKFHEKNNFKYAGCQWNELEEGFPDNHLGFIYSVDI